jgi:hypothetical protein
MIFAHLSMNTGVQQSFVSCSTPYTEILLELYNKDNHASKVLTATQ